MTLTKKGMGLVPVCVSSSLFFILVIGVSAVGSQQAFQIVGCSSGKVKMISESDLLAIYDITGKGTAWSTVGAKTFDNLTWDFAAILRVAGGQTIGMGYYKFTDPDGDYFIMEATGDTVVEGGTWKFLTGTGKWKGILTKLQGKFVLRGKPLSEETEQYWCRAIGTIELLPGSDLKRFLEN